MITTRRKRPRPPVLDIRHPGRARPGFWIRQKIRIWVAWQKLVAWLGPVD